MNKEIFQQTLLSIIAKEHYTQSDIARIADVNRQYVFKIVKGERSASKKFIDAIQETFPNYFKNIVDTSTTLNHIYNAPSVDLVSIKYRPQVELSAGYGCYPDVEDFETVMIERKLLVTDKGLLINPNFCEIVRVSGDSMLPEYRDGDKVVIDKSITNFIDGHIFAFRYNDQCYIKMINVLPDKIKCIPLNEKYDTFYINKSDSVSVLGLILPRIRF